MTWDLKEPECLSQARLMVAAPEFVYEKLKFYSDNIGRWEGKEELEKLLLKRNDKMINLALAQFATHKEIVQQLYDQACVPTEGDAETYNSRLSRGKSSVTRKTVNHRASDCDFPEGTLRDFDARALLFQIPAIFTEAVGAWRSSRPSGHGNPSG